VNTSSGFCQNTPDTNRLGTHRHYFGTPKNPLIFYRLDGEGSFKIELSATLLKAKTLCKIRNIDISKQFSDNEAQVK
jgi:hypothetical protein